jgi:hypothetical protein
VFENFPILRLPFPIVLLTPLRPHPVRRSRPPAERMFQLRGLAPQTGRPSSNILIARSHWSAMSTNEAPRRTMSIARHRSRPTLSRYSHMRMEAKRRALDRIATRQREAEEKRKKETEPKRQQEPDQEQEAASQSALVHQPHSQGPKEASRAPLPRASVAPW